MTLAQEDEVMGTMDNWDVTLLIVAAYLAIVALARLMARHRDQMIEDLRRQIATQNKHKHNNDEQRQSA
jgi:hypothetical protein